MPGIVIQLLNQCFCVICFRDFRDDVGIKIAVGTFADAIGDMNVEEKGSCSAGMIALSY